MRVKVELTGEEILALLECYRVLGKDLGSVHPMYRVDAHKAAYALGDGYRESIRLADEAVAKVFQHGHEPDLRSSCAECYRQGVIVRNADEAVAKDRKHEAHGGDESPDREGCEVCIEDLDFFLRYGGDLRAARAELEDEQEQGR